MGAVSAALVLAVLEIPSAGDSTELPSGVTHTVERGVLVVSVTEKGVLESANNTKIRCRVRGNNTITWVVESGTRVKPGDKLVTLDTLIIEEEIAERTKFAHLARAEVARTLAEVRRAELAINEYLQGRFVSDLSTMEKDLAIAESNLRSAQNMSEYAQMMAKSGYVNDLEVEEKKFYVTQSELAVQLKKTEIEVLKKYTKEEQLARLQGDLNAAKANYEAEKERAAADQDRLDRALEELEYCDIKAAHAGLVIYPSARKWEDAPKIEEGATVHKDQVLLLMPDLMQMQVKVGIHESIIDLIKPNMEAVVTLPEKTVRGKVTLVSPVARPAGWWTGTAVKYDTIIELSKGEEGLKPGMTAEVKVLIDEVENAVLVPTAAVIETTSGYACWVKQDGNIERRSLSIGQANDFFVEIKRGVTVGEDVVLNPLTHVHAAQQEATAAFDLARKRNRDKTDD